MTRALAVVLVVAAVAVAPAAAQEAPAGDIVDFELLPEVLTVSSGETITWTNRGDRPHTVTDRGGTFDTDPILPGGEASITVDVPGTYEIFCRINPSSMNARIVVEPGDDPPAAVRVQALDDLREGETLRFDPAELEVGAGTTLVLANVGGLPHSLRADDGSFRIAVVEPGAEQGRFAGANRSVVLDEPGTYGFFCDLHPDEMRGTVVVTGAPVEAEERAPPADAGTEEEGDDGPDGPEATATMVDFAFEPSEVAVDPGATVTWRNEGDEAHTVTFDDVDVELGPVEPGAAGSADAPADPGSYSYLCSIHPEMRGVLLVRTPEVPAVDTDAGDEPTDGTAVAYALALVLVGTGAGGLALGLRKR